MTTSAINGWRIYYGDGGTYSNRDGSPFDAPQRDVQVIAYSANTPHGFAMTHSKDAYFWRADLGWNGSDQIGLYDYLINEGGPKKVIFGRSIRDDLFWSVVGRASKEGVGA